MANTLIIGDIAEGSKWFGQVEFLKQQLLMTYKTSNRSMHTWKALSSDVSVFIELRNGEPYAFIYVGEQGDYEFFAAQSYDHLIDRYNGIKFYKDKPEVMKKDGSFPEIVLRNEVPSRPVNTWHSEECWVTGGIGIRYIVDRDYVRGLNVRTRDYYPSIYDKVEGTTATPIFTGNYRVNAASKFGNYCFALNSMGVSFIWDIRTGDLIYSSVISIDVPADLPHQLNVQGYWAFNRAGDKACTRTLIQQSDRHGVPRPSELAVSNVQTSYVVEVTFNTDQVEVSQVIETADFALAADYDWTSESNDLIIAEVSTFDYWLSVAIPWTPNTVFPPGTILKNSIARGAGPEINLGLQFIGNPPQEYVDGEFIDLPPVPTGSVPPVDTILNNYHNVTQRVSDSWLNIKKIDGTLIKSIELQYNVGRDWGGDPGERIKVYNTDPVSLEFPGHKAADLRGDNCSSGFLYDITALDLRVLGASLNNYFNTEGEGASVSIYDIERGAVRPSSEGKTQYPSNSYSAYFALTKYYSHIDVTVISAVPYLRKAINSEGREVTYPIRECAVYAPSWPQYGVSADTLGSDTTVDIMIDKNGTEKTSYHANTYIKADVVVPVLDTGTTPYLHAVAGGWAKKKDRP